MVTKRIEYLRRVREHCADDLELYNNSLAEEWRRHGIDPAIFWRLLHNPSLCKALGLGFFHSDFLYFLAEAEKALEEALRAPKAEVVQEETYQLEVSPMFFAEALRKGHFDHIEEPDVTAENFGDPESSYAGAVSLLQMNRHLWPDEIESVLEGRNQRWGGSAILLAMGAEFPEIQRSRHILSGASAMVEAPGLMFRIFLRDFMGSAEAEVSIKHLVHLHLSGGRAVRSVGTTRIDKMNDQITAGSTWILAVPK